MAFNKQSFLASKEAKSLTSEEIQQEIDYQESIKGNFPDAPTPTNAGPTEAFKQVTATNEAESKAAYDKAGSKGVNVGGLNIPDWLLPPAAIATTGAVGYGLYKLGQRSNKASKIPPAPELTPHQQQLNELELQHKRSQIAHIDAKTQKVLQVKPTATPTAAAPPANIAPQPVAPTQAPAAPSFGKGTDMPLNPVTTTDIQKIAQVTNPTTTAMAEVATSKPAEVVSSTPELVGPVKPPEVTDKFKGLKSQYKSVDQIPAGFEFKPGVHVSNMDNFLHSVMGPEHRLYAKELINKGQMFPEVKGTGFNTEASKLSRAYQGALQSQKPESLSP